MSVVRGGRFGLFSSVVLNGSVFVEGKFSEIRLSAFSVGFVFVIDKVSRIRPTAFVPWDVHRH